MKIFLLRLYTAIVAFTIGSAAAWLVIPSNVFEQRFTIVNAPMETPFPQLPMSSFTSAARADESYAVYSAVLGHDWWDDKHLVIEKGTTERFMSGETGRQQFPLVDPALVQDFRWANNTIVPLSNRFNVENELTLVDFAEISKLNDPNLDYWEAFEKRYPGAKGLITLSAVGFDRDMTRALVNVGYNSGYHPNQCGFYVLEKTNGEWNVINRVTWYP